MNYTKTIFIDGKTNREEVTSMAKAGTTSSSSTRKIRPAITPEARENQMVSLAVDLAERQLLDGTASSQVITHFLKLGSVKEKVELEKLKLEKDLVAAKTESLQSTKRIEELYTNALNAMKSYNGQGDYDD